MIFINRLLLLVALTFVISACQFVPTASSPEPVDTPIEVAPPKATNPYLKNRPTASAAAVERYQQAKTAMLKKDWQQAEKHLFWLTENAPELSGPYVSQAWLYYNTGHIDKVAPAFKQAIAVNSNNVSAYNQYGIFLRGQGDFDAAEALYKQALIIWPDYPEGHLNLGILYDLYRGQLDLALAQYQQYQALQSEPDRQVAGWIIDTQRRIKQAGE